MLPKDHHFSSFHFGDFEIPFVYEHKPTFIRRCLYVASVIYVDKKTIQITMVADLESAKRRVVGLSFGRPFANDVRQSARCRARVVAMSHCRSVQIEGLTYKPSDRATTRRTTNHRLACFAVYNATMRRLALCRVVTSEKTKRR
jgi:hypothetical protein